MLDHRMLIVTGKGGTGRSAVTAALALRAARVGRRVLAMALTDPKGLAIHFGARSLDYEPTEVHPGVWALHVDRTKALDEYLHLQLHLPRLAPLGPITRPLDILADAVPGIRDVITIGKPAYEVWQERWDIVICDGPPLGQIMSYLRAPQVIAALVPAGRVEDQSRRMAELLEDPDESALVITAIAEELPVAETREALAELEREPRMNVTALVLNRLLPAPPDTPVPEDPSFDAVRHHERVWQRQQELRGQLPADVELPYLLGVHTPTEVATKLADLWGPP